MNPDSAYGTITPQKIEEVLISKSGIEAEVFDGQGHLPLEDLGIDSLAVLELQTVMQDEYGITVPDEAIEMSVTEIVDHVNAQTGG